MNKYSCNENIHICSTQPIVDCTRLNFCHGIDFHLIGDDVDNIWMNQFTPSQIFKFCYELFLDRFCDLLCGRDLLGVLIELEEDASKVTLLGRFTGHLRIAPNMEG